MRTIDNVETLDAYSPALTIEQDNATSLLLVVANNSARVRVRPARRASGGDESYGSELLFTPQAVPMLGVSGVTVRSAIAGSPARVVAVLTSPDEPQLTAGIPFLQTLAASGAVGTAVVLPVVALADFPPTSPVDGQVILLETGTADVRWLLSYNAGTGRWDYVGGPPLSGEVATAETRSSAAYGDLATVGPSVTVPRAGDYEITWGCTVLPPINNTQQEWAAVRQGGAAAADDDAVTNSSTISAINNGSGGSLERTKLFPGLTASEVMKLEYRVSTAFNGTFSFRFVKVTPVSIT